MLLAADAIFFSKILCLKLSAESPSRQRHSDAGDNQHRNDFIFNMSYSGVCKVYGMHDFQSISQWIQIGDVLEERRHVFDRRD